MSICKEKGADLAALTVLFHIYYRVLTNNYYYRLIRKSTYTPIGIKMTR